MNLNIPSDLEKKVDSVIIALPFSLLSLSNLLKNRVPSENDVLTQGDGMKFRIRPGDASINFSQKESKSGVYWSFKFDFDLVDNTPSNFNALNRFLNQKIIPFISTSAYIYQLGYKSQPLDFSFKESLEGFRISIDGKVYFPAGRKRLLSFRSSF